VAAIEPGTVRAAEEHRQVGTQFVSEIDCRGDDLPAQSLTAMGGGHDHAAEPHDRGQVLAELHVSRDKAGRGNQPAFLIPQKDITVLVAPLEREVRGLIWILLAGHDLCVLITAERSDLEQLHHLIVRRDERLFRRDGARRLEKPRQLPHVLEQGRVRARQKPRGCETSGEGQRAHPRRARLARPNGCPRPRRSQRLSFHPLGRLQEQVWSGLAALDVLGAIGKAGATPVERRELAPELLGLAQRVAAYERLAAAAAASGNREMARLALMTNPLVREYRLAETLLERLIPAEVASPLVTGP
jgi:Family 4 glycosyl hydrolase C-terminal domain